MKGKKVWCNLHCVIDLKKNCTLRGLCKKYFRHKMHVEQVIARIKVHMNNLTIN